MKSFFISNALLFCIMYSSQAQIIDGYTDQQSYNVGEKVRFYTKSIINNPTDGSYLITNVYGSYVTSIDIIETTQPLMNTIAAWENGFGYTQTASWTIPAGTPSGMYFLKNTTFWLLNSYTTRIPIIVKAENKTTDIVIVCPTNTEAAYGQGGGKNMYGTGGVGSPIVSFNRPITGQGQNHIDLYQGFLKWILNKGYNVNVISDQDMDNYNEITNAKLLIVIGHSEYWTRDARLNFDKFVDEGNDAMVLSGNSMWWQVRQQTIDLDPLHVNRQMVCYRGGDGAPGHYIDEQDQITNCDPLLWTYQWNDAEELKYSILGSIGSDFHPHGGYGSNNISYSGFNGHTIILQTSPLLNIDINVPGTDATGLVNGDVLYDTDPAGELDGTLINRDGNGNPILDINEYPTLDIKALGFYRGEIIGYDLPADPQDNYSPIMAFQRRCDGGKIINVNSNYWCSESHFNGTKVETITQNMINLLLAGANIFVSPAPTSFTVSPAASTVCYSACTYGYVHITPCGVEINDGYRVDQNDGAFSANIKNCTSCARGKMMSSSNDVPEENDISSTGNYLMKNNSRGSIQISPNPNNGTFNINITKNKKAIGIKELKVIDMMGKVIWQTGASSNTVFDVDISNYAQGIYYVRILNEDGEIEVQKLVKQ